MDEPTFMYNAWKTCLEMAKDRAYHLDDTYNKITITDFRHMLQNNNNIDIICNSNENNPNKMLYIKFILTLRVKPSSIKEIIDEINTKISDDKQLELTIVLKSEPNNSILKLQKDKTLGNMQIMWCKKLQFNITQHELVPEHTKLTEEEYIKIVQNYNIVSKVQLPTLLKTDTISQYYNYKTGDIIKITNTGTSQNSGYIFYRCVR
jgi:DNA-directed RNA polymerase subunit H (RpoH/RPB5)